MGHKGKARTVWPRCDASASATASHDGLLALLPHEGVGVSLTELCDPEKGHAAVLSMLNRLIEAGWRLSDEVGRRYFAHAEPTDSMVSA